MEWLIAHEGELDEEAPSVSVPKSEPTKSSDHHPKSDDTDNCPAKDSSQLERESLAAKKKITVEEAQRLITERQVKRAEEERKKAIENEKRRRVDGQKMAEVRAELQDQERINLAQQIRMEKLEKELHRKKVLDQIARDREAMREKNNPATPIARPSSSGTSKAQAPKDTATECRIALRFPDGSTLVQKFLPIEQLSAVKLFAQMRKELTGPLEFIAPPNRKLTESMMNQTIESLGLCPASRLEVQLVENFESD